MFKERSSRRANERMRSQTCEGVRVAETSMQERIRGTGQGRSPRNAL